LVEENPVEVIGLVFEDLGEQAVEPAFSKRPVEVLPGRGDVLVTERGVQTPGHRETTLDRMVRVRPLDDVWVRERVLDPGGPDDEEP
jgi:hypothetical protein